MSPGIWREERKQQVFGDDPLLFNSRNFHSARVVIFADSEWHLQVPNISVRKSMPAYCTEGVVRSEGRERSERERKRGRGRGQERRWERDRGRERGCEG